MLRILSYVIVALGLAGLFLGEAEIGEGIICIVLGLMLMSVASGPKEDKLFKEMVKSIREKGLEGQIRSNVHMAIEVYKGCPNKKMLEYIRTLNPAAAQAITEQNSARKK